MNLQQKVYRKARLQFAYAYNNLRGITRLTDRLFRDSRGLRILVYHGLCKNDPTRFNSLFLTVKTFESHLKFFKKYFNIVSLGEVYNESLSRGRFNICITFDDGFANNYEYALPLIHKYDVPAAFFITAIRRAGKDILWNDYLAVAQKYGPSQFEFLGDRFYRNRQGQYVSASGNRHLKELLREKGFDDKEAFIKAFNRLSSFKLNNNDADYWLQLTADQIKQLSSSPLATIGCHGYYHNDLSKIAFADAAIEMRRCKQFLEEITQRKLDAIAFPYGAYTREVIREAKAIGFNKLLAADFLFSEDRADQSLRERFTVNPYISLQNQMMAVVNGKYQT